MVQIFFGFFLPFFGTVLGATLVFFMKKNIGEKFEQFLIGLAGGMMMAAAIWSLIMPSIEMPKVNNKLFWLPCLTGFCLGVLFLIVVEIISAKFEKQSTKSVTLSNKISTSKKTGKMLLAIMVHNIPEGMAVGVALAGAYCNNTALTSSAALTLAIGIGVQNFPDGAIVSMPLYADGCKKTKAFLFGVLSAVLELVCALFAFFLTELFSCVLPYILAFAAGATIFVVIKDLVPSSQTGKHQILATLAFALGFLIMMIMDVAII